MKFAADKSFSLEEFNNQTEEQKCYYACNYFCEPKTIQTSARFDFELVNKKECGCKSQLDLNCTLKQLVRYEGAI